MDGVHPRVVAGLLIRSHDGLTAQHSGVWFSIKRPLILLGRGQQCDIELSDPRSSRVHAEIRLVGSSYLLNDRGSTNGTQVNGLPVRSRELADGDEILIGDTQLVFHLQRPHSDTDQSRRTQPVDVPSFLELDELETDAIEIQMTHVLDRVLAIPVELGSRPDINLMQMKIAIITRSLLGPIHQRRVPDARSLFGEFEQIFFEALRQDRMSVLDEQGQMVYESLASEPGWDEALVRDSLERRLAILGACQVGAERIDRAAMAVPLIAGEQLLGLVLFDNALSHRRFLESECQFAVLLARILAIALDNLRMA